ncbi:MAG TPA: hypothetical protein VIC33_12030 [Vicinamibacterales bacterium]|jgi:hypothetical protein
MMMKQRPATPARPWTHAALAMLAAAALALGTFACGGSPTGASASVTETFNGTLSMNNASYFTFTVAKQGTVTMTATALSPQSGAAIGLGLGQIVGTSCLLQLQEPGLYVGQPLTFNNIAAGAYCGQIFDIGYLTEDNTYTVSVAHP